MLPHPKDHQLAKIFINHSLNLKEKEKVLITVSDSSAFSLAKATYIECLKKGLYPVIDIGELDMTVGRSSVGGFAYQFYKLANDWQLKQIPENVINARIEWADAFIRLASISNSKELAQIKPEKLTTRQKIMKPLIDKMIDSDRWILTVYPTPSMAQDAGVSYDWLLDFYYNACIIDYNKMKKKLKKIEKILDKGKRVEVFGKKTKLAFSIKDRLALACYGERNIPDGEVFLAPIKNTLEGEIFFDLPTRRFGRDVEGVYLKFKKGKVVEAKASKGQKALEKALDTDEGARYIGEFAIGANYEIYQVMKNTLFDEKIGGTIHMALGRAYKEKRGGGENESAIHWDIVKDMRLDGSIIKVDNKIVLKEGKILT